eukprot:GFUD01109005.1.p1 GENE.GFUD01109005.1~~GFUD01109005.1.p1  ORF type:complete len:100 (+),score=17.00 GFUD01109005.1:121-420(+)
MKLSSMSHPIATLTREDSSSVRPSAPTLEHSSFFLMITGSCLLLQEAASTRTFKPSSLRNSPSEHTSLRSLSCVSPTKKVELCRLLDPWHTSVRVSPPT